MCPFAKRSPCNSDIGSIPILSANFKVINYESFLDF
jgi:hypothetical protein